MCACMRLVTWNLFVCVTLSAAQSNERSFPKGWSPFKALAMPESEQLPRKQPLKRAHRKAALQRHPDKCSGEPKKCEKKMAAVNVAHEILGDRKQFEQWKAQRHG